MGRPPKDPDVKEAQGNPGRRDIKRADVEIADGGLEPPFDLSAEARAVWDRLIPTMPQQFRKAQEVNGLARYCDHLARWIKLTARIDDEGESYESSSEHVKMYRLNPAFTARRAIEKDLVDLEDRFGLNPRNRLVIQSQLANVTQAPLMNQKTEDKSDAPKPTHDLMGPLGSLNRDQLN